MEYVDYFNQDGEVLGTTTKKDVHKKGLWHKVVGCIFIDSSKGSIYLQYKSANHNEVAHKNKIDLSVGGHLQAKEGLVKGVLREIEEESSLKVDPKSLYYLFDRVAIADINPEYKIREFVYMFLLDSMFDLNELHSEDDEVLHFIEFNIDSLLDFITGKEDSIFGITPGGLFEYTNEDFIGEYLKEGIYLKVLLSIREYLDKKKNKKLELTGE